jgi:predicted transcriptional regulator
LAFERSVGIAVDPFIGRGGALNRAITNVLGAKQPLTTRQISKHVANIPEFKGTSCSTVNKRVRDLEKNGYLKKAQVKERVGGITNYYELTPRVYLAKFMDSNSAKDVFNVSNEDALIILADFINAKNMVI